MSQYVTIILPCTSCFWDPAVLLLFASGIWKDGCLTHTDGVGGVQLAALCALTVEGPSHIAAHSIDARVGEAFVDI